MALSLQEQLLKAGLTNEKKAKKAKKSNKKNRELKREVKAAAEEKRQQQQAKDKALNQELKQKADEKAIQAQIKQLIEANKIDYVGDIKYNFMDGKSVQFINVNDKVQKQLASGLLAIVNYQDDYAVIPGIVSEKIALRDDTVLVAQNQVEETDEDDPYADYVIPDDLMW